MDSTATVTREALHSLVDRLSERELSYAERFLRFLLVSQEDPVARAIANAPEDNEEETPEEAEAVRRAKEDLAAGRVKTAQQMRRELGL